MYAKSIMQYVKVRAEAVAWTRHLVFVPVVLALAVALLPFTLERPAFVYTPPQAQTAPATTSEPSAMVQNPFTGLVQANVVATSKKSAMPLDAQQRAIANYIKRKYGVSAEVVQELVRTAFAAGKRYGVDPLLVVAVMAVESSYNPIAESYAGAKGLMQIIPKYHLEKFSDFGGETSVFDPRVNIVVGTRILREYLLLHAGDVLGALQYYAGATSDKDAVYTQRVLNEKDQLDTLAGFPKTERRHRQGLIMQPGPEQPGAITVIPAPKLNLPPDTPAAQPAAQVPAKPAEEAAQSVPQPQAGVASPVKLTQSQSASNVARF